MLTSAISPIDAVIAELQALVSQTLTGPIAPSRIGYFASLYLRVTCTIKSKIGTGYFDDDARMERLDADFASRYLAAVKAFLAGDPPLQAGWETALQATGQSSLIVVQQLLLSMNPHINLDLAQAAVATCPGPALAPLHDDFMKITTVLGEIIPTVVAEIGTLSPLIGLLNYLDSNGEFEVLNFSMTEARNASWAWANLLNAIDANQRQLEVARMNGFIATLGSKIVSPGLILQKAVDIVKMCETDNVPKIIQTLNNGNPMLAMP